MFRNIARHLGPVDRPDVARKVHKRPVPRVGGVPILLACLAPLLVVLFLPSGWRGNLGGRLPQIFSAMPALLVVFLTGLLDDFRGLKPWQKLVGETVAALLACAGGIEIHGMAGFAFPGWAAIPLTFVWLIGCTNAINLIDGMDGLATGIGLFASVTMLIAALLQGDLSLALVIVPIAGALCGFLRYNFSPASVFLGDSGSLSLGFLLGANGIIWSEKASTLLGMTAPAVALTIPLLDTGLAIARRALRGLPIFGADRRHIHHVLLDRGLTPRQVVLLIYGASAIPAALSLLMTVTEGQYAGLLLVMFCAAAWTGIQYLGYIELNLAGRLLRPRTFQRILNAQVKLQVLETQLQRADTVDECWTAIRGAAHELGFQHVAMRLDHTVLSERLDGTAPCSWVVHIPLSETEFVDIGQRADANVAPAEVAPLADLVHKVLQPKLPQFQRIPNGE